MVSFPGRHEKVNQCGGIGSARAAIPDVKTRKQHLVREIIWEAATSLFAEKGYDETTVDEIAQAAGVSPRSCFRYFANKSDIMAYSLVSFAEQIIAGTAANVSPGMIASVKAAATGFE